MKQPNVIPLPRPQDVQRTALYRRLAQTDTFEGSLARDLLRNQEQSRERGDK